MKNVKQEAKKPEINIRVGASKFSVWENKIGTGENAKTFLTASLEKNYFDEKTNEFKPTSSYSLNDLLKLRVALDKTINYMTTLSEDSE